MLYETNCFSSLSREQTVQTSSGDQNCQIKVKGKLNHYFFLVADVLKISALCMNSRTYFLRNHTLVTIDSQCGVLIFKHQQMPDLLNTVDPYRCRDVYMIWGSV